ncbi:alpha/beta fold hydrolase [Amycolatopsis sp.]|uniref:alpha/beta fold hydrolase n=1 Tax=Amycolatopsis sp. TaxID=37632 RepID=UPI002DF7F1AD|nr:alpha/beta fold hydrolase [Amycolatopsis sp.]
MSAVYKTEAGGREVERRYRELLEHWPTPHEQLRIPTREGETFVVVSGPESAPPLLLLHGAGGNALTWASAVPSLAQHFRMYVVDVIGEPGLSSPSRPPLDTEEHMLWLDDVMDGLGLASAPMVGVSLGGLLALDYATRRPDRVERLALLNPAGVGKFKTAILVKLLFLGMLGDWGLRRKLLVAGGAELGESTAAEFVMLVFKHFKPRLEPVPLFDEDTLRGLRIPTLVLLGARDAMIDARGTQRRFEHAVPHAEVVVLPEAGHFIGGEAPPILDFLRAQNPKRAR